MQFAMIYLARFVWVSCEWYPSFHNPSNLSEGFRQVGAVQGPCPVQVQGHTFPRLHHCQEVRAGCIFVDVFLCRCLQHVPQVVLCRLCIQMSDPAASNAGQPMPMHIVKANSHKQPQILYQVGTLHPLV